MSVWDLYYLNFYSIYLLFDILLLIYSALWYCDYFIREFRIWIDFIIKKFKIWFRYFPSCTLLKRSLCLSLTLMPTVHLHSISYCALLPCLASGASLNFTVHLFFAVLPCTDVTYMQRSPSHCLFSQYGDIFFLVCNPLHNGLSEYLHMISCKGHFIIILHTHTHK